VRRRDDLGGIGRQQEAAYLPAPGLDPQQVLQEFETGLTASGVMGEKRDQGHRQYGALLLAPALWILQSGYKVRRGYELVVAHCARVPLCTGTRTT
jgi:hypothetical protein